MSTAKLVDWFREKVRAKKGKPIPSHVNFFYCFGGISLFLILIQLLTGVTMLFFYTAEPEEAFNSIIYLSNEVPLGWVLRDMHRWTSTLLLATVFSHMIIVFYLKAYQSPRQLTWLSGVFQLLMVFLMIVTGIILPWNWRSYWSFALWMDYVETWTIGGESLKNLFLDTFTINAAYYTHILAIPLVLAVLLLFHFRMVKRHGISEPL
jgi:quinol-cytochrome oxidoreductase complex cytochrome b subunit